MADDDESTCICCGLWILIITIPYIWDYLKTGGSILPIFYGLLLLIILVIVLYEIYNVCDKPVKATVPTFCLIIYALILIFILFIAITADDEVNSRYVPSSNPSPTLTSIQTVTITKTPTIPTASLTRTVTPRATDRPYADPIIEYSLPIAITTKDNIEIGDIIQQKYSDSSYDQNKAYLVQNYIADSDKYLILSLTRDLSMTPPIWFTESTQNTMSIYSSALIRQYPNKIGHATGIIPTKSWVRDKFGDGQYQWIYYPQY